MRKAGVPIQGLKQRSDQRKLWWFRALAVFGRETGVGRGVGDAVRRNIV